MKPLTFIDEHGSFTMKNPENTSYLYFPLASENGLKSAVTPNLGGDAKIDQETFLLEPVSAENLHNNRSTRNFWCVVESVGAYSAAGASAAQEAARFTPGQDESELSAGFMWHTLRRVSKSFQLESNVTTFLPKDSNVEIHYITVRNLSARPQRLIPYGAIPIYGRSADNIRDHRNVTSMLHRIRVTQNGVLVQPTMSFDEKGHRPNHKIYYVCGFTGTGGTPERFYPTVEEFLGEGGTYTHPRTLYDIDNGVSAFSEAEGKEAMGAFRFPGIMLEPGQTAEYILLAGAADSTEEIDRLTETYRTSGQVQLALDETRTYWQNQVNVSYHTADPNFDGLMKWISFQPFLRRLFGCSFLPHHDYGRGGRGWRDLWQDCLSLLFMEPQGVGQMIAANYGGVRIDGTNATIIGSKNGSFIADRNGISRVWMDHALWPLMTTKLYIDQTGDVDILLKEVSYFKDAQVMRGTDTDDLWRPDDGCLQLTARGETYTGTILEHLLIQQLTAFYEVGEHNIYRLRGADWNDALDMAAERGESVAFTCAYAGNLRDLASLLQLLESSAQIDSVELLEEIAVLLNDDEDMFADIDKKREILDEFAGRCRHTVSGGRRSFSLSLLTANLIRKANWLTGHIRTQEWIDGPDAEGWFNSYYDNSGRAVEGFFANQTRMMLTGQVFAIMGNVAENAQIQKIVKSADHYLYQKEIGGYRLNTNFHELKFDMGRMFGFAYGEKENGAVFSHMTVMYANALYRRGFVKEGWKALKTLADASLHFDASRIYPGIPEYFNSEGRGMYQYLTGAASWYMMTMITEVFGVHGQAGDLVIHPKLLGGQFDQNGLASLTVPFAGKTFRILFVNQNHKDYGSYIIDYASCDKTDLCVDRETCLTIPRQTIAALSDQTHEICVNLI